MQPSIGFAGLSHLGLVSGICIASKGFEVVAFDPRADLVQALQDGKLPIFEPGLEELLSKASIRFTSDPKDLAQCSVVYLAQDVATNAKGESDLGPLLALSKKVVPYLKKGTSLVVHSQVPPGFTRDFFRRIGSKIRPADIALFYQVETLIFGQAVQRALQPERYIVGTAGSGLTEAYSALLNAYNCPVFEMKYESAELAKISINLFLISTVCTTNMLAEICEKTGASWAEIAPTLKLDRRIGPYAYLAPGLGISGGNLERDMATVIRLGSEAAADIKLARSFVHDSAYRKNWVARKLREFKSLKKVALWGLTYKANTRSIKNSPAIELLGEMKKNRMKFTAYDPQAEVPKGVQVSRVDSALEACTGADALVIMTPWPEFGEVPLAQVAKALKGKIIVDPLGAIAAQVKSQAKNFEYFTLGGSR